MFKFVSEFHLNRRRTITERNCPNLAKFNFERKTERFFTKNRPFGFQRDFFGRKFFTQFSFHFLGSNQRKLFHSRFCQRNFKSGFAFQSPGKTRNFRNFFFLFQSISLFWFFTNSSHLRFAFGRRKFFLYSRLFVPPDQIRFYFHFWNLRNFIEFFRRQFGLSLHFWWL